MSTDAPPSNAHRPLAEAFLLVGVGCAAGIAALLAREVPSAVAVAVLLGGAALALVVVDPVRVLLGLAAIRALLEGLQGQTVLRIAGVQLSPTDLLTLALLAGAVLWLVARTVRGAEVWRAPTFAPAAVLLAVAALSLLASPAPALGARDLVKFAAAYAVYLVIVTARPDAQLLRAFLWALIGGAVLPIIVGLGQFFGSAGRPGLLHGGLRIESTFDHPNTYGFYLVAIVAAAWGLRWMVAGRARLAVDAIAAAAFVSAGLTLSRNAWAAMAIVVVAIGLRHRRVLLAAAVGGVALVALAPRLLVRATDFFAAAGGATGNSLLGRLALWGRDLDLWRSQPLFGRGWGSTLGSTEMLAHNDFLRALVEAGIVGFIAYVAFIGSLVALGLREGRDRGDLPRAFLGLALGYALVSVSSNNLGKGAFQFTFWLLAGLSLVYARTVPDLSSPDADVGRGGGREPVREVGPRTAPPAPDEAPPPPSPSRPPESPRALLLVSVLDGSGPGRVMATLAGALPAYGVEAVLVATHGPTDSPLIRETVDAGIRVEHLGMRSMVDPRGPARLRDLVRESGANLVHTRTIRADLVGRSARRLGVAVVNNLVNLYPEDCLVRLGPVVGRATMSLLRATTTSVDRFVANSRAVADNVTTEFGVESELVRVIYDGLPSEPWRSAAPADLSADGIELGVPLAVTVARLHPQKGLEDLVDAAAMVTTRTGLHFAVAGEGPSRASLEARIRAAGLEDRVVLLGERSDVPQLLAGASLFVLPSHFEGLPSAIIEAMMASCPVVATTVGGNPELVVEGETGWLVPPGDPAALADALVRAIGSDLDGVGAAGARRAEERFSVDTMTSAFAELYREVLEERAGSEPAGLEVAAAGAAPPA